MRVSGSTVTAVLFSLPSLLFAASSVQSCLPRYDDFQSASGDTRAEADGSPGADRTGAEAGVEASAMECTAALGIDCVRRDEDAHADAHADARSDACVGVCADADSHGNCSADACADADACSPACPDVCADDAGLDCECGGELPDIHVPKCGDAVCETGEGCSTCPQDCGGPCCGQGVCDSELGEDKCSCPEDCGLPCEGRECGDDGCGGSCGTCDDDEPCTQDESCDPETGQCEYTALDGVACEDGNLCTSTDECVLGSCVPGITKNCEDATPCTKDEECNPVTGLCVKGLADGIPCDNADPCTVGDFCSGGSCVPGADFCATFPCSPVPPQVLCSKSCYSFAGQPTCLCQCF